ncbi:MAG: hypothetical protein KIT83_13245 [Bryobacterales bacterium]|nr:hypothetical protein [Bryobacterales bacterium]
MNIHRLLVALSVLMISVPSVFGHFVFVSAQPGGREARIVMSEDVKPDLDVKLIASTRLEMLAEDGSVTAVNFSQPEKNYFSVAVPGSGTRVLFGKTEFGVVQRGESKPHLLIYYPKSVIGDAFSPRAVLGSRSPVELQAMGDAEGIRFRLTAFGKPVTGGEVVVILPDGSESKVKTDGNGETEGEFRERGQYAVWARYWVDAAGEYQGKAYEQVRHYATLVVDTSGYPAASAARAAAAEVVARMPEASASFGATSADGWLYVYGGHTAPTHVYHKDSVSGRFHRMRLQGEPAWETLPSGPGLQGMNLVAHDGGIYRVGGMRPVNEKGKAPDHQSVREAARFDTQAGRWEALPDLPQPLSSHDVAVVGNKLYVVGGWNLSGKTQAWSTQMLALDLAKPDAGWQVYEQPFKRRALMAASFQGKLWVVGGIADNGKVSQSVEVFDPQSDRWSEGPALPEGEHLGFSPAVGVHAGALFAAVADGRVLRLKAAGTVWESVGEVTPRVAHRLVSDGNRVLVLGGASKGKNLDIVELVFLSRQ